MNIVYEEVLDIFQTKLPQVRYVNWDLGQLSGYYLKPSVTYPCVLISFPKLDFADYGDLSQRGDVIMQLKICTAQSSNTSNLTPALVRAKGNMIWELENEIFKALQGKEGLSFNTMTRMSIKEEPSEIGLQILNVYYTFLKEDYEAQRATHKISPMSIELHPELDVPSDGCPTCANGIEFATLDMIDSVSLQGIGTNKLQVTLGGVRFIDNTGALTPSTYTLHDGSTILPGTTNIINVAGLSGSIFIGHVLSSNGAKVEFYCKVLQGVIVDYSELYQGKLDTDFSCKIYNKHYSVATRSILTQAWKHAELKKNNVSVAESYYNDNTIDFVVHDVIETTTTNLDIEIAGLDFLLTHNISFAIQCIP